MTRNKFNRLVRELISKYGDVVVVVGYDYYKSKLILKEGEESDNNILLEIRLSDYIMEVTTLVPNRTTIGHLEDVAKGKVPKMELPIKVEESKKLYDSDEQVELRNKRKNEFQQLFGSYTHFMNEPRVMHDLQMIQKFEDRLQKSSSPKEYGKYLSNK